MSANGLVEDDEAAQAQKKKKNKSGLVIMYDEDARKEYLTGFRKRKQERRKVANDAIAEKERIARRNAKKERKLELLRAYGVEVQQHVEPTGAGDAKEATYDGAENAITVRSSALVTKKVPAALEDADEVEDDEEGDRNSEDEAGASGAATAERPKDWKQVRQARHAPKKRSWSKTKAKKIKKHHKKEQKAKGRR